MKQKRQQIDMLHGPLAGKIVLFALPVIAGRALFIFCLPVAVRAL